MNFSHLLYKMLIIFFTSLLLSACVRDSTDDILKLADPFACENFHYFDSDTAFPTISAKDSINIIKLTKKYSPNVSKELEFNPAMIEVSKGWYNKKWTDFKLKFYYRNVSDSISENFKIRGLDMYQVGHLIWSDAVVLGEVIAIHDKPDSHKCVYHSIHYIVKVKEVLHSYFKLKEGDLVLIAAKNRGPMGGCDTSSPNTIGWAPSVRHFRKGETNIFLLSRARYRYLFYEPLRKWSPYNGYRDEVFCPNKFGLESNWWETFNYDEQDIQSISLIDSVKCFFKIDFKRNPPKL